MDNRPVAGIDVSKASSDMCVLAPDNTILARLKFAHTSKGLSQAVALLEKIRAQYDNPIVIMESTGHYHRIPHHFFQQAGFEVIVINPLQSHAISNIDIRKIKTDKADAYRIALLYRLKEVKPSNMPTGTSLDLRALCRQYAEMIRHRTMYMNKLNAILDQSFPGFSALWSHMSLITPLELLKRYPTPLAMLEAIPAEIMSILKLSRKGEAYRNKKLGELLALAAEADKIAIPCDGHTIILGPIISVIQTLQANLKLLSSEILRLSSADETIAKNRDLLDSIPGISTFGACLLLAEIGDPTAFRKPTQLAAFFGLEPSERQSGQYKSSCNKITKRGSSYVRRVLSMSAISCVNDKRAQTAAHNPVLAEFYKRKCETKPKKVVICAVMHKLIHIIFAVLRDQRPFELRSPQEHAKMLMERQTRQRAA